MRIVEIEDFFHPEAGYQINILSKYLSKMGHDVHIVTGTLDKIPDSLLSFFGKEEIEIKDKAYSDQTGVMVHRIPLLAYKSGRAIFPKGFVDYINNLKPDIIYAHGNDTESAIRIIRSSKIKVPIITDSHMLEMASVNPFYKLFRFYYKTRITPRIIKKNITVIRTQNNDYVQKCLGIPIERCPWISYGSDLLLFHSDDENKRIVREKYNIPKSSFVVLYAGKLGESKGGLFLAKSIRDKISDKKDVVFLIIGNTTGDYGKLVDKEFDKSDNRIIRIPTQKYTELANWFQTADLAVFPKQCSLSFYDVQACGLPVLFENNTINIDRAQHKNAMTFESNNMESFRDKLRCFIEMPKEEFDCYINNAKCFIEAEYNYQSIAEKYMHEIQLAYEKQRRK